MENKIILSKDQQECMDLISTGNNIFISGKPGSGKSFITKEAVKMLRSKGKNVAVLGLTGVAANNIKGQTMHSFCNLPIFEMITEETARYAKEYKRAIWDATDVIVIDEVSMMRPDHLDGIDHTLIKNGCDGLDCKQIILIGDLKQLPPIVEGRLGQLVYKKYKSYCFKESDVYRQENFVQCNLSVNHRQSDPEFIKNLNLIRDGKKAPYFNQFVGKRRKGILLAPHKSTVDMHNKKALRRLKTDLLTFEATYSGQKVNPDDFNVESMLKIKDGARVMFLVNQKPLVNGSIGKISVKRKEVDKEDPLCFLEEEIELFFTDDETGTVVKVEKQPFEKWAYDLDFDGKLQLVKVGEVVQYPIKLAYALTIHKSQGLTFKEVTVDLSKKCFAEGQLYTALSRVTSPEGLCIISK